MYSVWSLLTVSCQLHFPIEMVCRVDEVRQIGKPIRIASQTNRFANLTPLGIPAYRAGLGSLAKVEMAVKDDGGRAREVAAWQEPGTNVVCVAMLRCYDAGMRPHRPLLWGVCPRLYKVAYSDKTESHCHAACQDRALQQVEVEGVVRG